MTTSNTEGVGYTGASYEEMVQWIKTRVPPLDTLPLDQRLSNILQSSLIQNFNELEFNAANPLPKTLDDLLYQLGALNPTSLKAQILGAIKASLRFTSSSNEEAQTIDQVAQTANTTSSTLSDDIAESLVNQVLTKFPYNGLTPITWDSLAQSIATYANTTFATLSNDSIIGDAPITFLSVFNAYYTGNNLQSDFITALTNFISSRLYPSSGNPTLFAPSQSLGDWMSEMQKNYLLSLGSSTGALLQSSLGASYQNTNILERIFALIVAMVGILQKTTAAQADRLTILTQWQSAYTELQGQVHIFLKDQSGIYSGISSGSNADEQRGKLNDVGQSYVSLIQSRRSVVQDDAKAVQASVNQTNDTVSQQASMATSFIQTLSTLLSAIYR